MKRNYTAEEVRAKYVDLMGADLGQLYHELQNEVVWVHRKWHEFKELYGKKSERIDLLNKIAPHFFWLLQKVLIDDVLLHLARLSDPPQSVNRDNLTIRRLAALVPDADLKNRVEELIQEALTKCKFARDRRNRRLAHSDLQTSRNEHPAPLLNASRQDVEWALESMRDLLNCLELYFCQSEVSYQLVIAPGGADSLLSCLEAYLHSKEDEVTRWQKVAEDQAG